jgi:hypothetical protein
LRAGRSERPRRPRSTRRPRPLPDRRSASPNALVFKPFTVETTTVSDQHRGSTRRPADRSMQLRPPLPDRSTRRPPPRLYVSWMDDRQSVSKNLHSLPGALGNRHRREHRRNRKFQRVTELEKGMSTPATLVCSSLFRFRAGPHSRSGRGSCRVVTAADRCAEARRRTDRRPVNGRGEVD